MIVNNINTFYNTEIKNTGFLPNIGNLCFMPIRLIFAGDTIAVHEGDVYKVPSYPGNNALEEKSIIGFGEIASSRIALWKVAAAIAFIVPGILFGTFVKGLSYAWATARTNHRLVANCVEEKIDKSVLDRFKLENPIQEISINM